MLVDCGHRMCQLCLDKIKADSDVEGLKLVCPLDSVEIMADKVYEDKGINRVILDLSVKCDNAGEGCEWVGKLHNLENHMKTLCEFKEKTVVNQQVMELMERLKSLENFEHRMRACEEGVDEKDRAICIMNAKLICTNKYIRILQLQEGELTRKVLEMDEQAKDASVKDSRQDDELAFLMNDLSTSKDQITSLQSELNLVTQNVEFNQNKESEEVACMTDHSAPLQEQITALRAQMEIVAKNINSSMVDLQQCAEIEKRQIRNGDVFSASILNQASILKCFMNIDEYVPGERTVFNWQISTFSEHAKKGEEIYSSKFYARPNGHCCMLSLWFDEEENSLGLFLHTCKGVYDELCDDDFDMAILLESTGENSKIEEHISRVEVSRNPEAFVVNADGKSSGYGKRQYIKIPDARRYVVDDMLSVKCTLLLYH